MLPQFLAQLAERLLQFIEFFLCERRPRGKEIRVGLSFNLLTQFNSLARNAICARVAGLFKPADLLRGLQCDRVLIGIVPAKSKLFSQSVRSHRVAARRRAQHIPGDTCRMKVRTRRFKMRIIAIGK